MVHDSKVRKHYLRIVDAIGSQAERRTDARRQPLGFVMRREDLYKQPYAMPSTFIEERD